MTSSCCAGRQSLASRTFWRINCCSQTSSAGAAGGERATVKVVQLVQRRKSALVAAEWMRTEGPRGMTVEEEEAGDADDAGGETEKSRVPQE